MIYRALQERSGTSFSPSEGLGWCFGADYGRALPAERSVVVLYKSLFEFVFILLLKNYKTKLNEIMILFWLNDALLCSHYL